MPPSSFVHHRIESGVHTLRVLLVSAGLIAGSSAALGDPVAAADGTAPVPLCLVLESVSFSDDSIVTRKGQARLLGSLREPGLFEAVAGPYAANLCTAPAASLWLRGTWTTEEPLSNLPRALVHGFTLLAASRLLPLKIDGTLRIEAVLATPNGRRFNYDVSERVSGEYTLIGPLAWEAEQDMNDRAWAGAMAALGRHLAEDADSFVGGTGDVR